MTYKLDEPLELTPDVLARSLLLWELFLQACDVIDPRADLRERIALSVTQATGIFTVMLHGLGRIRSVRCVREQIFTYLRIAGDLGGNFARR